jgi:hypothetical protein
MTDVEMNFTHCLGTAVTQGFFIIKKYVQHNHKPLERIEKEDD